MLWHDRNDIRKGLSRHCSHSRRMAYGSFGVLGASLFWIDWRPDVTRSGNMWSMHNNYAEDIPGVVRVYEQGFREEVKRKTEVSEGQRRTER
jgi:hypothetical protein